MRLATLFFWIIGMCAEHAQATPTQAPPGTTAIAQPLAASAGDPLRGRAIVANRQLGLCLLCHAGPIPEERFQGNLAPDLAGAGTRWSDAQLRARLVDPAAFNPGTVMPSYSRTDGLNRVGAAWAGAPVLSAQQVDNGNAVPVRVAMGQTAPAGPAVLAMALFNERNPQREVAAVQFGLLSGKPEFSTRIRLATSQKLVAMALLQDGSCWSRTVEVVVTLAACIEGES